MISLRKWKAFKLGDLKKGKNLRAVEVYLGGRRYLLNTDEDKAYLQELSRFVNSQIEEFYGAGKKLSLEQACCLSSLKIADSLFKLQKKHDEMKSAVKDKTQKVVVRLKKIDALPD